MLLGMHQHPQGSPLLSLGHELQEKVVFRHTGVAQTWFWKQRSLDPPEQVFFSGEQMCCATCLGAM